MPIPASQIVQVNPRLLKPGGRDLELNGLLLSKSNTIPAGMVMAFGDPESVGSYFGLMSEEYRLAVIYFLGYTNSFIKPRALFITRRMYEDSPSWVRGGTVNTKVSDLKLIADGELTLTMGTHTATLTGLSFVAATTYSDIAIILQGAIRTETAGGSAWTNANVTYSSLFKAYTITSGESGAEVSIDYPKGLVADALSFTLAGGAVTSQGADKQTEAENMESILTQTQNWVTFTTTWLPEQDEVLAYSVWATGKGVAYAFVFADTSPLNQQPNNKSTISAAIKEAKLGSTVGEWGGIEYAAFVLSIGASIDFNRYRGTITTAFKSQEGLSANCKNSTDAINLQAQGLNIYGDYATRNDQFVFHYPGQMFGTWAWLDTYLNAIWLNNALQVSLMAGLSQSPRTPYNDEGYALVRSWCQDPINRALYNGVISSGVVLSESQKAQINREAGLDISIEVEQLGYYLQVLDPGANARINRDSPIVSLWYTDGGSINKLVVASTALV